MSSRQICPACRHRENGIIETTCIVCDGVGVIYLGDAALTIYTPEVIAEAITITLEAAARLGDTETHLADDRLLPVRAALLDLRDAGVLDAETTTLTRAMASKAGAEHPAKAIAAEVLQEPILTIDTVLPDAAVHEYDWTDRPGVRGLPVLSKTGHPSSLARLTDPADPFADTAAVVRARHRKRRQGQDLAAAVKQVPAERIPYRGRKRAATGQLELIPTEALTPAEPPAAAPARSRVRELAAA